MLPNVVANLIAPVRLTAPLPQSDSWVMRSPGWKGYSLDGALPGSPKMREFSPVSLTSMAFICQGPAQTIHPSSRGYLQPGKPPVYGTPIMSGMQSSERVRRGTSFAASAGTHYAAEAAAEVYRAGGNAADAAVAAAASVGVTEPLMSSIGGGGFALVRSPGGAEVGTTAGGAELIDYYDCMPGKGLPSSAFGAGGSPTTMILKYGAGVKSIVGAASCAVPGSLRGWELLLRRHGRLTLREALAPAVRLAREGFRLCKTSGLWFEVAEEVLRLTDETRKNFYKNGRVYRIGEELRFPELADTLEAVGEAGADLFYEGELARLISSYILREGGIITEEDLASYTAIVREPLSFAYSGSTVHTNGPPSAGGPTLAQMARVISGYDLTALPDEDYARVLAGAMKYALEDRDREYTEISENAAVAERLTGEEYVSAQRARIWGSASRSCSWFRVRFSAHHPSLLRGRDRPRRLHNREHGLRLGHSHPRHRYPDGQHSGGAGAKPERFPRPDPRGAH